jgi:hypothetical protein
MPRPESTASAKRILPWVVAVAFFTPQSTDPLSPFNWAGKLWEGSVSSSFSASYDDGSWSVKGTAQWAPFLPVEGMTVGHIIHERNGVFASRRDDGSASE